MPAKLIDGKAIAEQVNAETVAEIARLKEQHRLTPGLAVILTGTVPRAVNAAKELCDDGPMPKPYEPRAVYDQIRRLLAARNATRHK